jgi:hypothetical protein
MRAALEEENPDAAVMHGRRGGRLAVSQCRRQVGVGQGTLGEQQEKVTGDPAMILITPRFGILAGSIEHVQTVTVKRELREETIGMMARRRLFSNTLDLMKAMLAVWGGVKSAYD